MMRIHLVLLSVLFILQLHANDIKAQKLTLNTSRMSLENVLKEITRQTGYDFLYNPTLLKQAAVPVTINSKMTALDVVLAEIFKGQPRLTYTVDQQTVVVRPKREKESPRPANTLQQTIDGKVTAETGEPLSGVSIQVKGETTVASTDENGLFSIAAVKGDILIFSYIGFISREINVLDNKDLNIELTPSFSDLDEVVVVGYGTQRKADLTGAIGSLQGSKVVERNVTQTSLALQGAVPGLTVTRSNGAPGTSSTLRVRGVTTIGDSDPLILIDGVPASSIDNVHPADIENISVLKDASAASIYGSKAAAGVILVTTKKGVQGKLELDFTYNWGLEKPSNLPEYADVIRYMEMVNELQWNDTNNPEGGEHPVWDRDIIDNYYTLNAENPDLYPNTNWQDMLLYDRADRHSYLLNIAGGTEKVRTRASLGYDKIGGLYMGKAYNRLNARVNTDININSKLKSSINTYFRRTLIENPSESPMTNVYRSAPVYAAVWSNGLVAEGKTGNNMYAQLLHGGFDNSWSNQLGSRASLDFQPFKDLSISAVVAPVVNFNRGKEFRKKVEYTNYDDPTVYVGVTDWGKTNSLNESRVESFNNTSQLLLNYNKTRDSHHLDALAGFEHHYLRSESLGAFSDNLELDSYPYLDLANRNFLRNSGNAFEYASSSYFGRLNYNYANKYLLQTNFRIDGSSRFHKDYRWGIFPSFSAGWVISEENFFPKDEHNTLSFLKLRGSYGVLGNERIGNYPYQATISFANALLYQGNNIAAVQTAAQQAYAIENITWETTTSYNIGFDIGLLNNKLNFNFDYFRKNTRDMLLALEIPLFMGYDKPEQNAGKMHTNGWELIGQWNDETGDFRYGISVNISDAKSIIDDLSGIQFLGNQIKIAGNEFDAWYGYRSAGLFQTQEEIDNSPVLNEGLRPGDVKYLDISGPDGVPDGIISPEYDRVPLGGSLPRFTYGGNFDFGYKQFDLALTIQGVAKQKGYLTGNMVQPYQGSWGNMPLEIDGNYWSMYNTEEQNLAVRYPRLTNSFTTNNYATSDFWLFDGSYFRLKNIVLGYTFADQLVNRAGLKGARLYMSSHDILSLNRYPRGWDPEIGNSSYPITRSFNIGLSVKF